MLTVLNIIIIVVLLGMAAIWATYGFFSSFLHLVLVILAGTFAFAVWEPLAYVLLGRMPLMAWGVGLLAPFALSLIVMRTLLDKYCKMNLKFPRLADQIGGAVCGVASGVLTVGVLLIGIGFLSMKPDIMGYQPYRMSRNTVELNEEGQLWAFTQVDKWAGNFFSSLSTGSMAPMGGTPLAVYKSDIASRAQVFHLTGDPYQSKFAAPDSVKVLDAQIVERETFLDMIVRGCFEPLVTSQINLNEVTNPGPLGGGYAEFILAEYQRRLDAIESIPQSERNASNRPTAIFNMNAIDAVAERLIAPPAPGSPEAIAAAAGGGGTRGGGLADRVEGAVTPDGQTPEGGPAPPTPGESLPPSGAVGMLSDPVAFFDLVIEKQVQPTVQALQRELEKGGNVVIIDTQWSQKPAGTFDSDGWLRVALPSIQLISRTVGEDVTYQGNPPIAYAIEEDQNTGARALVDLVSRGYNSADAQINDVKLGWVFVIPTGHEPFRFEARQLGFDMAGPLGGDPGNYEDIVAMLGAIDVPEQKPPPAGIQIGDTGAVVELDARLPRSISPNAATNIESNQETEPWTAFRGEQTNILRSTGGRRSQMRALFVAEGKEIVRVVVNADSDQKLLNEARLGSLPILIRDDKGAEHSPVGYALLHQDDSMDLSIRSGEYDGGELPRVASDDILYIYFEVRTGVSITHFVVGQPDGDRIEFAQPITIE